MNFVHAADASGLAVVISAAQQSIIEQALKTQLRTSPARTLQSVAKAMTEAAYRTTQQIFGRMIRLKHFRNRLALWSLTIRNSRNALLRIRVPEYSRLHNMVAI